MLYIRLEGHDFRYEIEDAAGLFFKEEEITVGENEPEAKDRGIFLLSGISRRKDGYALRTKLAADGAEIFDERVLLECPVRSGIKEAGVETRKALKREVKRQAYSALQQ